MARVELRQATPRRSAACQCRGTLTAPRLIGIGIELVQGRTRIVSGLAGRLPKTPRGHVMKIPCTVRHLDNGRWLARSTGSRLGTVEVSAASRDEALEKLRASYPTARSCVRAAACRTITWNWRGRKRPRRSVRITPEWRSEERRRAEEC